MEWTCKKATTKPDFAILGRYAAYHDKVNEIYSVKWFKIKSLETILESMLEHNYMHFLAESPSTIPGESYSQCSVTTDFLDKYIFSQLNTKSWRPSKRTAQICRKHALLFYPTRGLRAIRENNESKTKTTNFDSLSCSLWILWMALPQFGRPEDLSFLSFIFLNPLLWFGSWKILHIAHGEVFVKPEDAHYSFQDCKMEYDG